MIKHYNSLAALREDYILAYPKAKMNTFGNSWYGGETVQQTSDWSLIGNTKLVPQAEKMIQDLSLQIETPRKTITRSVAGGWPDVPAAIVGYPLSMCKISHEPNEYAPINIYVCTTSSASINAETLQKRGNTILALVMALSQVRPLNLHVVSTLDGNVDKTGEIVLITKINTTPLDLATACYALTSVGFDRRLCHTVSEPYGYKGGWPAKFNHSNPVAYTDYLIKILNLDPKTTLFIQPSSSYDKLLTDPITWINNRINQFITMNEE